MREVPIYSLYGEAQGQPGAAPDLDFLHCETIPARSRLHGFRIRPHRHAHLFQTLFLSAGHGEAVLDGETIPLAPPCAVTVPAGTVHGFAFSEDVDGLVLTLYERQVADILRGSPDVIRAMAVPRAVALGARDGAAAVFAASLNGVAAEFAGAELARSAMMRAQLAVGWLVLHRADAARPAQLDAAPSRGATIVARFRAMIEAEFHARKPIEDYARRLGVTEVQLRRLCRAQLGTTPLGAVNARIVLEAKRLLAFTSLGVKEIAAAVGFGDHAYFSRFFQRETGQSPSAFRAARQGGGGAQGVGSSNTSPE